MVKRLRPAPLALFVLVFLYSGLSPVATSFDSRWTVYEAMSLWRHGNIQLDDYPRALSDNHYYAVERFGGHWYSMYPPGGPVLTAPLTWACVAVFNLLQPVLSQLHSADPVIAGFLRADFDAAHSLIEKLEASFLLAATAVVIYGIARRWLPRGRALILALLFATATSAYSVAGRALWQHTPSILLISLAIYLLLAAEERPWLAAWSALPIALAYTARPTNALVVVVLSLYLWMHYRRYFGWYLALASPIAIAFLVFSQQVYQAPLPPYFRTPLTGFEPQQWKTMLEALCANLVSPGRGLLVYTPVFVFALWAMVRRTWKTPLAPWLAGLALLQWLIVSAHVANWWAGQCYGPRFLTDMTPVLVLFLIPWFERWPQTGMALRVCFVVAALAGWGLHTRGGWSRAVYEWNQKPDNIDEHPERVWDWQDPPFLRR